MAPTEKFCLRWNDFESNISVAFRELREDKDFFDVTLACDDDQVPAHKVILSACSPFFRSILRRNRHDHPLLYLKGVKYADLLAVLNFMYHGEVNVAQEELNSFLAVAEDLKVKGLTQNTTPTGGSSSLGGGVKSARPAEDSSSPLVQQQHSTPRTGGRGRRESAASERSETNHHNNSGLPPAKRSRLNTTTTTTTTSTPVNSLKSSSSGGGGGGYEDDDIQEVVPVKSEPVAVTAMGGANDGVGEEEEEEIETNPDQYSGRHNRGEVVVAGMEYGSEDYGAEYEGGYEGDGGYEAGMLDPNITGGSSADGNKDPESPDELDALIAKRMLRMVGHPDGTMWKCTVCERKYKDKTKMKHHIETHLNSFQTCHICSQMCKTRRTLKTHIARSHGKDPVGGGVITDSSAGGGSGGTMEVVGGPDDNSNTEDNTLYEPKILLVTGTE